ncbi:hypothetical protein PILCRDRAFT_84955 [Piloderma croceum F 1598]|uniref:AN1-type domain-containing protein n=1 Tax=Piloderma croceum (strain F 1598) TaxID=765440 RepID=A0A0C3FYE4_PILCF|nr:hypothetical protein PILCRDRAFT_84955 [Piloderma croceum F 1598]
MATTPDRDERLLSIGQQCSDPSCLLVDFLPFKCQHCTQSFCGDHFKVEAHKCPKYDESKHNRVAPSCPLCNNPVAIPLNQDPNIRMEQHINTECSVMTGKRQTKSGPVCARAKCGKVLFAPINCKNCNQQFCPSHRFPADHSCTSAATTTATHSSSASKPASQHISEFSSKASATSSQTLEAVRRKWAATPTPSSSRPKPAPAASPSIPSNSPSKAPSSHSTNPFSKTDRRAKAEKESRRRAMEARAKKGLLTEEEKVILEAENNKEKKDDCLVM